jgi:hypothetical protein
MNEINTDYIRRIIYTAEKTGYAVDKAITEYTKLEISYSPHPFQVNQEAQDKALKEMQHKMLTLYIKDNK